MTTYRLDQLDRGTVALKSGQWRWYVIRVNSLPEGICELQYLIFANETGAGDIMRARVPSDIDEVSEKQVLEYARAPEDRSFRTAKDRFLIRSVGTGFQRMWQVRREQGHLVSTNKHVDKPLGELSRTEIEDIADSAL